MTELINVMLSFFLVSSFGYYLGKKTILNDETANHISSILVIYIFGITMVKSFIRPFDIEELKIIGLVFIITVVVLIINIIITKFIFKDDEAVEKYAVIFNNKGFVGIPVVAAVLGDQNVIYLIPAIIMSNIFVWTFGNKLLGLKAKFDLKSLLLNPSILAFLVGLVIFIMPFELPKPMVMTINYLAALNTPLAMLLLGYFLRKESIIPVLRKLNVWKVTILRLIISPLIVAIMMKYLPIDNDNLKMVMILAWACPTAMNTSLFVSHSGKDPTYAAQITATTSLLSVITIPLTYSLVEYIL